MHSLRKDWWWIEWPLQCTKTQELLGNPPSLPSRFPSTLGKSLGHGGWISQYLPRFDTLQRTSWSIGVSTYQPFISFLVNEGFPDFFAQDRQCQWRWIKKASQLLLHWLPVHCSNQLLGSFAQKQIGSVLDLFARWFRPSWWRFKESILNWWACGQLGQLFAFAGVDIDISPTYHWWRQFNWQLMQW